jgi:hypothetical protein
MTMRRVIRGVPLIAALALLVAAAARADVPSPSTSTVPPLLLVVGNDGLGTPDPVGAFTVVVRKLIGTPMPGAVVTLDFQNCPDLAFCADQHDPNVIVDCGYHTIRGFTDGTGTCTFHVLGCGRGGGGSVLACGTSATCP